MAEYIDRKKYMKEKYNCDLIHIESLELVPLYQIIDRLEQSIERSEYEYLKKENRELAIKYDNAMNMVINEQENVTRLRGKIDKAIKEMESIEPGLVMECDEMRDYCVDILKRNIGE